MDVKNYLDACQYYVRIQAQLMECNQLDICEIADHCEIEFLVNECCLYPMIRPMDLDFIVDFCSKLMKNPKISANFKKRLISDCLSSNSSVILERLYCMGELTMNDIIEKGPKNRVGLKYFLGHFPSLKVDKMYFDKKTIEYIRNNDIIELVHFGWPKTSLGYSLKFDDVDSFLSQSNYPGFNHNTEVIWSVFEWANKPKSTKPSVICAHFGSLKCFKQLLLMGCVICEHTAQSSCFGGNIDIVRLVSEYQMFDSQSYYLSVLSQREEIVSWIESNYNQTILSPTLSLSCNNLKQFLKSIEQGDCINERDKFSCFIITLFFHFWFYSITLCS